MSPDTSSGRRKPRSQSPGAPVVAIVVVTAILILVVMLGPSRQRNKTAAPGQSPAPTQASLSPPATGIPSPSPTVGADADLEEEEGGTESPAALPSSPDTGCVGFSWRAGLKPGVEEPVPVAITVSNACQFVVDTSNIAFEIEGIRDGGPAEIATGACTGDLAPGESTLLTITLPARSEGYERIEVKIVNQP